MRSLFWLYVCLFTGAASLPGATPSPVLSPANPSVGAGQSITLTSSVPVIWSLSGKGSISSQTGTTVVYTAPSSVIPQSAVLGCPAMPNDSVFNTRADALPTNAQNATWLAHMSSVPLSFAPSWGITYADAATATNAWKPYYGNNNGNYSLVYNFPWPGRGPALKRENGNYVGVTGYSSPNDHHTVTVRRSDCEFFETYDDRVNGEVFTCADHTTTGCNLNSIDIPYGFGQSAYNNGPYAMPYGSTDAAGLPLAPLSWHLDEIKSGSINHVVRFTASIGYIDGFVWPAATGNAASPSAPPYGARFLLKTQAAGGPNPTAVCTPAGGSLNLDCVTMLTALQQQGMMLADIGLNNQIETFTDVTEDATARAALKLIAQADISISEFRAVDESSLRQTSAKSYATFANGSYGVDPSNGYVTPVSSAIITATPVGGSPVKFPIALQGTAVGLASNVLTISAGMSGYQLASWVNPSTLSQSVSWSLVNGVGSVTSGGVYTPPNSTAGGNTAVLKAKAAADSNAVNYVYVNVVTTSSSPVAGTIRIDSASEVSTTDGNGNIWNAESGMEASLPTESAPDYPTWPGVEGKQYGTQLYTRGGDIAYNLVVPNGNYKVRVMYGQIFNGNSSKSTYSQSFVSAPALVEAQGIIASHFYDWNAASGFLFQTAADTYIPAKVTNNALEIRAMVATPDTAITAASGIGPLYPGLFPYLVTSAGVKTSSINGIEIIPDSTVPHWAVDTQGVSAISPGQNIQLYNVDWYTGVNDPKWSIVSGPAGTSITSSGLLCLAASASASSPITVMASDGTYSAVAAFNAPVISAPVPPSVSAPSLSPAPVSKGYAYVRSLTISHSEVSNTDQTNFPVVISLADVKFASVANGGHVQNPNGYDIVFASDAAGTKLLQWEVEDYDSTKGQWVGHVNIPNLSHTLDTTIYLLYGNAAITTSLANPSAVWDSNYKGVYHFASPLALMKDSTQGSYDGTSSHFGYTIDGAIGGAVNAAGGSATLPAMSMLNAASGTIEMWVNSATPEDATHNGTLLQQSWFDSSAGGFSLGWSGYFNDFEVDWKAAGKTTKLVASAKQMPIVPNTWNQIAYTWNRGLNAQSLYLNGLPVVASTQPFGNPVFDALCSFSVAYNPSYYGLTGLLDEARFSSMARSADWIKTEFQNQKPSSNFVSVGAEQSNSAAKPVLTGSARRPSNPIFKTLKEFRTLAVAFWRVIRHNVARFA